MGNRIFAFLGAAAYARLSGRRLFIDWRDGMYAHEGTNAFDAFFESPAVTPLFELPDSLSVAPTLWVGRLSQPLYHVWKRDEKKEGRRFSDSDKCRYRISLSNLSYPEDTAVRFSYEFPWKELAENSSAFPPEWPKDDVVALARQLLREYLVPRPAISTRVDEFVRRNFLGKKVISLHIRHTDNIRRFRSLLFRLRMNRYCRRLDALLAENPGSAVFLSTDDPRVLAHFQMHYKNILSTEKFYPDIAGKPIHFSRDTDDRSLMGMEALIDMYLLSHSDYLIRTAKSSFSTLSIFLAEKGRIKAFDVRGFDFRNFWILLRESIDCRIGLAGIWLKRTNPRLYRFLRPSKSDANGSAK